MGIVLKGCAIEKTDGESVYLRGALANAYDMLAVQYQAAQKTAASDMQGRPLSREVLREMEAMTRLLGELQPPGSSRDATATMPLARETEETLARMRARGMSEGFSRSTRDSGPPDPQQLQKTLQAGFSRLKVAVGLKALQQLVDEDRLQEPVLDRRRETDPLALAQIPLLAEETHRQGLSVLTDALTLAQAIRSPERERLEAEVVRLEAKVAALKGNEKEVARLKMREETPE